MPMKKQTPISKSAGKHNLPEVSPVEEGKNGQAVRRNTAAGQMESFELGMRLFHARQFRQARDAFQSAMRGPDRSVAHRAGLHARMCESRLTPAGVVLNTPEDHYNYAVTLINTRNFAEARQHLQAALDADPTADHVLYALAACQALSGDLQAAYENLKLAIDLQPRNRLAALQDPDFAAVADHPAFARLLHPKRA